MIIMAMKSIIVYQRHHDQHECHDVTRYLNIKMFKTGADTAAELAEERVICYIGEAQAGGFLKMIIFMWTMNNDDYATTGRHKDFSSPSPSPSSPSSPTPP